MNLKSILQSERNDAKDASFAKDAKEQILYDSLYTKYPEKSNIQIQKADK